MMCIQIGIKKVIKSSPPPHFVADVRCSILTDSGVLCTLFAMQLTNGHHSKPCLESHRHPDWKAWRNEKPRFAEFSPIHDTFFSDDEMLKERSGGNIERQNMLHSNSHSPEIHPTALAQQASPQSKRTALQHEQPPSDDFEDQTWQSILQHLTSTTQGSSQEWNNPSITHLLQHGQKESSLDSAWLDHSQAMYDSTFGASKDRSGDFADSYHTGSYPVHPGHGGEATPWPQNIPSANEDVIHTYSLDPSQTFSDPHHAFHALTPHVQPYTMLSEGDVDHLHSHDQFKHMDTILHHKHPAHWSPHGTFTLDGTSHS